MTRLNKDLDLHFRSALSEIQQRLKEVTVKLQLLDPQKVLERGYTMTEGPEGKIMSSLVGIKEGDVIRTYFKDGALTSIVSKRRNPDMAAKKATFEDNMKRLEEIVEALESGNLPLEDTVKLYKEGMTLSAQCGAALKKVEQEVEKVTATASGDVKLELFPEEDA